METQKRRKGGGRNSKTRRKSGRKTQSACQPPNRVRRRGSGILSQSKNASIAFADTATSVAQEGKAEEKGGTSKKAAPPSLPSLSTREKIKRMRNLAAKISRVESLGNQKPPRPSQMRRETPGNRTSKAKRSPQKEEDPIRGKEKYPGAYAKINSPQKPKRETVSAAHRPKKPPKQSSIKHDRRKEGLKKS